MQQQVRETVAVMFTDMRGYSTLSQQDEDLALRLFAAKQALADPIIARHGGSLIKTIGDALMCEFRSAHAAVQCAIDLQEALRERNASVPDGEQIVIRIGIHLGDVVRSNGDILGETVNIASRIEPKAPPGGIAMSESVHSQVRGKVSRPLALLGRFELKGIAGSADLYTAVLESTPAPAATAAGDAAAAPLWERLRSNRMVRWSLAFGAVAWLVLQASALLVDIFDLAPGSKRVMAVTLAWAYPVVLAAAWAIGSRNRWRAPAVGALVLVCAIAAATTLRSAPRTRSVTVATVLVLIPTDLRPEPARADNLPVRVQEALLDEFARAVVFNALSRSAAQAYAPGRDDPLRYAADAGATHFVETSIKPGAGDSPTVELTLQLIEVDGGAHLASYTWAYRAADRSPIERDLATRITGAFRILLGPEDWASDGRVKTANAAARLLFKHAEVNARYELGNAADASYAQALQLDPDFLQALGRRRLMRWFSDGPELEKEQEARLGDAWATVPDARFFGGSAATDDRWDGLAPHFANDPWLWVSRATVKRWDGDDQGALAAYSKAIELDPYFVNPKAAAYGLLVGTRRYPEAVAMVDDIRARWPSELYWQFRGIGMPLLRSGDTALVARLLGEMVQRHALPPEPGRDRNASVVAMEHLIALLDGDLATARRHADWIGAAHFSDFDAPHRTTIQRTEKGDDAAAVLAFLMGDHAAARAHASVRHRIVEASLAEARSKPNPLAGISAANLMDRAFWRHFTDPRSITLAELVALEARFFGGGFSDHSTIQQIAFLYAWRGELDDATRLLKRCLDLVGGCHAQIVARDPWWAPLYGYAPFEELLLARKAPLVRHASVKAKPLR